METVGPLYQHGLGNVVIHGYDMHTAVGMWFSMLSLGIAYYAVVGIPVLTAAVFELLPYLIIRNVVVIVDLRWLPRASPGRAPATVEPCAWPR